MTDPTTDRDLIPPEPPPDEPDIPDGLKLGIDIEELYFFVGEGLVPLFTALGLGGRIPQMYENKLHRVRTALWSLPDSTNMVRQIDNILAQIPVNAPVANDIGAFRTETSRLERRFDEILYTVRQALPDDACCWYDLGVLLARLHLCLMVVENPADGALKDSDDIYLRELHRIVPLFAGAFLRVIRHPSIHSSPAPLVRSLVVLSHDIATFDDGLSDWCRVAREHADDVFTAIGMTHSGTSPLAVMTQVINEQQDMPAHEVPAGEVSDHAEELALQQARYREALLANEPEVAEKGLHELLNTARRTLDPHHPLIFMIQSDLSMALLALGQVPLCTDIALDAADEAALHLGDRHPVTTAVALNTLRMLVATGHENEAEAFVDSRLAWLDVDTEPGTARGEGGNDG